MAIRKSSSSGIPFGLNAGRPANPSYGQLYSNGETSRLEIYTQASGWQNIVQETPGVASATGHYYESDNYGTFTISGTNFVDGAIAYAVGTNGVEYQAQTTTYNSLVQLTTTFANLSAAYEPYDIKIINPSNLFGLLPDAFYINDNPVWGTTSGSLGTWNGTSIQLSATDDESNTITYSVTSGLLPTGLSLSSSGLISGTVSATAGVYTFTVSASDGFNPAQTRTFSISILATVTGGTLTSDANYYYRTFTSNGNLVVSNATINADILVIAGGAGTSGGGSEPSGGGGAGGLVYNPSVSLSSATYTATVGGGGAGTTYSNLGSNGVNSTFTGGSLSLTAAVGGGRGGTGNNANGLGASGGSGGGGSGWGDPSARTGGSGQNGQGNAGGTGRAGSTAPYSSGGGGGAGAAGGNADTPTTGGGSGGVGLSTYSSWGAATSTGQNVSGTYYYAGGGAGTGFATGAVAGVGGYGGGGAGAAITVGSNGFSGTSNTGGGGGGASGGGLGGSGGSGVVIVRYTKASVGG